MRQTGQNACALVEQQTKESDARFIEKLNSSQRERRGSHSNNPKSRRKSVARDCEHEQKQAASKQRKVWDQQTEAANQVRETATPEHEGLTMQQQQQEAAEVRVKLEQQQKRQEEDLRLWRLKRQQWEEQMATKRQEQEAANEKERERLEQEAANQEHERERERLEQEAANQEHERERERLEQEAANQEHERERLTRHHQEHEADDLDRQNQEAANEERKRLAQQRRQTQQITKSFQPSQPPENMDMDLDKGLSGQPEPSQPLENMDLDKGLSGPPEPSRPPENMDMDLDEGPSGQPEPSRPSDNMDTDPHKGPSGQPEPSQPSNNVDTDPHKGPSGQPEPPQPRENMVTDFDEDPSGLPHPPGPPHPSGGVTDSSHHNSSSAGLCLDHLSELSAAIDQNTKMVEQNTKTVELALSQMLHLQRTANTSSTCKDQDEDLDEDSPAPTRKRRKFRAPAQKTIHRDPDQLGCRVCFQLEQSLAVLTLVLKDAPPESAPDEAVLKYNESLDDEDGPSKVRFRADLSAERPVNGPWNNRLFEIFLVDYARKHSDDNVKDLLTYFMTYLQTLQTTCRKMKTTEGKSTYERELLDVQPPLDMQFSDEERRRAATYIPLANGEARPLSEDADISGLDKWLVNMFGKLQTQRPD
ncbi:hypothetical protein EDB84DRAFT_1571651 [Lactarius hengduanensis]|nr:hypothetical protein EDB84DRAFT_1571651 [Lactarius hengduanensis]